MPYNAAIEKCIGPLLANDSDIAQKKMFGGICYLFNGHMGLGIYKDFLIVRCGQAAAETWLSKEGIGPCDITGRPMKGWIMADESHWRHSEKLQQLCRAGAAFARSLPPK
jgi:TfoX/Sxy family transcriptional regulator of competence genes